ncbi:FecR family protein [Candidatus Electrothrix laxa]
MKHAMHLRQSRQYHPNRSQLLLKRAYLKLNKTMPLPTHFLVKVIVTSIIFFPIAGHAFDLKTNTLLSFLKTEHTPPLPLLPGSLVITDTFKPSTQPFAGTVTSLSGTAYVYHKDANTAYTIKKDHPVFNGDTLVTAEDTRVTLHLADDSILILMAQSKLLIDRSLPRVKVRDTTIQLFFGKVRSLVKKITGQYTIKTPTGSLGVRGTDFAVAVAPAPKNKLPIWGKKVPTGLLTAVLTGGDHSTVELAGLFGPSIMVKPFSTAGVWPGDRIEQAMYVGPAAIPLLEKIAPLQEVQMVLPKQLISKKQALIAAPCWPFSGKAKGLKYFKVCEPEQKKKIKLRGLNNLLPARIKGFSQGFTDKNQKD